MDRSTVGRALDAMIDEEAGMAFQGLAVHLAQKRCPGLIACERKKDLASMLMHLVPLRQTESVSV